MGQGKSSGMNMRRWWGTEGGNEFGGAGGGGTGRGVGIRRWELGEEEVREEEPNLGERKKAGIQSRGRRMRRRSRKRRRRFPKEGVKHEE